MSQIDEETAIQTTIIDFINIHNKGIGVFNDLIRTSKTVDDLKHTLSLLVNAYFFETSLLFRIASISLPTAISMKKTIDRLPDKDEFNDIKKEANSQYDKVKEGVQLIKQALEGAKSQDTYGKNIYG